MGCSVRARHTTILLSLLLAIATVVTVGGGGCVSRKVTRIGTEEAIDLSGHWNDTDSALVARELSASLTAHSWRNLFVEQEGRTPVLIVGSIRNRSSEHIDVAVFVKDIERALVNSGHAQVVADAEARGEIRSEREEQQFYAAPETRARLINEVGADMILQGGIGSVTDRVDNRQVIFYQVDLELIDLERNLKLWLGSKEIRKFVVQNRARL